MAKNIEQRDQPLTTTNRVGVAPSPDRVTDDFWTALQDADHFDLGAILQSGQSLVSTLELDELIPQLLDLIRHHSDAETCLLALPPRGAMQTQPEEGWQIYPTSPSPLDRAEYPIELLNWVKNTRQMACWDARQPLEIADPYLLADQPPSVLAVPIAKPEKVLGVLYLEHRHGPNQFTPDRQRVISFLCTQAAIALDNANRYQQALHSQQRYQKLSDNIPGVIYQLRLAPDGTVSFPYISPGCQNLFELPPQAIIADASCLLGLMHPDDVAGYELVLIQSAQTMDFKLWEGRAILPSGGTTWIKSVSRPELQPDGSIIWDGMMLDISDRKQVEAELHQTNERLELTISELQRATQLKDEFLATMSHELRTPLNAILGMAEALQEEIFGTLNERQIQSIQTIERSGENLL
jgi:GAF domain-containing protein